MEVAFVLAPRQNLFFLEMVTALRDELERLEVSTSLHWGSFPEPRLDLVYAITPPHEYFTLMHGRIGPHQDVFDRTIFICAEQPGTHFFDWNVEFAPQAGAVFDINRLAVRALAERGIDAEHLQMGWTPRWDVLSERERDIDVLFMGAASERRLDFLSDYAGQLWNRRCHFVISDNSRPNSDPSGSFVVDAEKWDLLGRSKVLINLHQGDTPYFEWLRVVQAMASGCVVVSEQSLDYAPLQPGRDFLSGHPENLGLLAESLLDDGPRWWEIQKGAYETVRERIPLSASVARLASTARRLAERPAPDATQPFFLQPPPTEADAGRALARLAPAPLVESDDAVRRVLKDLKLDLIDMRRRLDRLAQRVDGSAQSQVLVHRRSRGWHGAAPRTTVLVTLYNYADHIEGALDSLLLSRDRSWEVVIVDDGSSDDSLQNASRWIERHDSAAALLLHHPVNRGLAAARNAALAFARGEFCFVLDADNAIYPNCLESLAGALDREPAAAFAYGMLERFTRSGSAGLLNVFPWEPARFRTGNYIDAMAMLRTEVVRKMGGYRLDRRLHGWEDYDLWCRMAEQGLRGTHVPAVVALYRSTDHSMLSVTNISGAEAHSLIAEASPSVFGTDGH